MNKWLIIIEVIIILGIVIYFEAALKRYRHQNKAIAEKYKELEQIHINLRKETEIKFLSTIEAMAESIDARDLHTGQHSKNVARYTAQICDKLNLDKKLKDEILIAASIHDIGKIGIEDLILKKPEKLTSEEYETMKKHPVIGANIIGRISGLENVSNVIRYHHERFDGKGYPDGLNHESIPIGSQIISVVDAYDAMTAERIYRKSLGRDKAVQILLDERNKQFNGEIVDLFIIHILNKEIKEDSA